MTKTETNGYDIYPLVSGRHKKNTCQHEASFLDSDKREFFHNSVAGIQHKSGNVPSNIFPATGAESLRIAGASNIPESFFSSIKPLITRLRMQGDSIEKINSVILKVCKKHQNDCNNICKGKQERGFEILFKYTLF